MNPIPSNRHESFPLLLIQHTGSRFARYLENIADLGLEGGLKMLSGDYAGWVENVVDSSRFDGIDTNRFPCCRFVMPEVDLRETRLRENRVESLSASYESSEVCCYVLRTRKVHVSLFHGC